MIEISCFYVYCRWRNDINFTFIKYKKLSYVISNLHPFFIMHGRYFESWFLWECLWIYTNQLWKHIGFLYKYEFTSFEKNQWKILYYLKNQSERLVIRRLINLLKQYLISDIDIKKIIKYEILIYNLCCIKRFNNDIYMNIKKFV